ncbi:MAG TPA: hypothetical protein VGQ22_06100 [Steroidobacteraceae bacterium]|nr:hypothetical protein [Steroidobacteraceae bacterium]
MDEHVLHILLGFVGVVAVFGRRVHGEWFPEDRFRLTNLMVTSLGSTRALPADVCGALVRACCHCGYRLSSR